MHGMKIKIKSTYFATRMSNQNDFKTLNMPDRNIGTFSKIEIKRKQWLTKKKLK
jgi:hypothetical protein